MSRESVFALKPRGIGELLDLTFRIFRHRFALFATVGVLIAGMGNVAGLGMQLFLYSGDSALDPNADPFRFMIAFYSVLPVFMVVYLLIYSTGAVVMFSVVRGVITGHETGWKEALTAGWRRVPSMLFTAILSWIVIVFGMFLCLLPGLVAAILFALAVPVAFLESRSPFSALGRSVELIRSRGPRGLGSGNNSVRVLVIGLVTLVVWYALNVFASIPQAAAMYIGMSSQGLEMTPIGPSPLPMVWMLPLHLLGAIVQGLFIGITLIPWAVLYFDIRVRHEGLDMEEKIYNLRSQAPGGD